MKEPAVIVQDETAWRAGFIAGNLGSTASCPYPINSIEALSWSSGKIEGEAAPRGTLQQLSPIKTDQLKVVPRTDYGGELYPLPHPEGEVYDPQVYRQLVEESNRGVRPHNGFGGVLLGITMLGSLVVGVVTQNIAGFIVAGITCVALLALMFQGDSRVDKYRKKLALHQLTVSQKKSDELKGKNVTNNVTLNFSNGSNFTGPLVVGENINVSYSAIQNASGTELKAALETLVKASSLMIEKLSNSEQKLKASEQLKTLTEQASNPKPSKWLLDVSAKGLLEAAKTVAEMTVPVTTAVKAVLALISGAV